MDDAFWKATAITLAINLVYTIVALLVGVAAVRWVDRYVYTEIDFCARSARPQRRPPPTNVPLSSV